MREKESIVVLVECADLQRRKSADYQNPNSSVVQAMHYRRGAGTIHDMIEQKVLRARSLIEAAEQDPTAKPKNESLEDTYKDIINYCSFQVSWLRGKMEGQDTTKDAFNRRPATLTDKVKEVIGKDATPRLAAVVERVIAQTEEVVGDDLVQQGRTDRT